jgi:NitT/TauT family transport system substrate-binding protein
VFLRAHLDKRRQFAEENHVRIILAENFRALFYAPFYAAKAIGAYAAEGLDVVQLPSARPADAAAALHAGAVDVMWGGPLRVMLTHAADADSDIVCFCDGVTRDPFFVIGSTPRPDFRFSDLAGLRLGIVSEVPTPWICLQDDMLRAGIDLASITRTDDATMAENTAALRAGALDAVQVFQPHAEELIASGAGHLWYAAATRGLTAYTTLVTRRATLAAQREALLAMTRAMVRALRWIHATPPTEIAAELRGYFPELAPSTLTAVIARYQGLKLYAETAVIQREGFERLTGAMLSAGMLERNIPFEECVDNTLAEQVAE